MDYHSQTSALMVGDPEVGLVMYMGSRKNITELLFAREEIKMGGQLLGLCLERTQQNMRYFKH